jgi:hypothetical protein
MLNPEIERPAFRNRPETPERWRGSSSGIKAKRNPGGATATFRGVMDARASILGEGATTSAPYPEASRWRFCPARATVFARLCESSLAGGSAVTSSNSTTSLSILSDPSIDSGASEQGRREATDRTRYAEPELSWVALDAATSRVIHNNRNFRIERVPRPLESPPLHRGSR